ncbi:MAG: hypothetical protein RIS94_785 [Pseudomonadota bacterium]|jgi:hypothetical protein
MKLIKTAIVAVAAMGLTVSGAAQAASTRAGASLPSAAKVKKLSRTSAPSLGEASNVQGAGLGLLFVGAGLAGWGFYEAVNNNKPDSPGV